MITKEDLAERQEKMLSALGGLIHAKQYSSIVQMAELRYVEALEAYIDARIEFVMAAQPATRPGKNLNLCPYPAHADDCDCQGMGGDR